VSKGKKGKFKHRVAKGKGGGMKRGILRLPVQGKRGKIASSIRLGLNVPVKEKTSKKG